VTVRIPTVTITATPDRVVVPSGTGGGSGEFGTIGGGGSGAATSVSWAATNVVSCTIMRSGSTEPWQTLVADENRSITGSAPDTITNQTVYSMTCVNNAGPVSATPFTKVVNVQTSFNEF
jgi:hypothetical protein